MNGRTTFPGEIPKDTDILQPQRNAMYALGCLLADLLQSTLNPADSLHPSLVSGFKPSFPGGLVVAVEQGSIFKYTNTDAVFGSLSADTRQVLHQGLADAQNLTFAAPPGAGLSRIDLVQVKYEVINDGAVVNQYYNSANPAIPLNGPGGLGATDNVDHRHAATVAIKAGTAATTGTQAAPTADAGYTPLFEVTIATGLVNIVTGNVVASATAPFLAGLTTKHHTGALGSAPKIDLTTEVQGVLPAANGGVTTIASGGSLPTAAVGLRGYEYILQGGTGVPDKLYRCMKIGDDTYDWIQIG